MTIHRDEFLAVVEGVEYINCVMVEVDVVIVIVVVMV